MIRQGLYSWRLNSWTRILLNTYLFTLYLCQPRIHSLEYVTMEMTIGKTVAVITYKLVIKPQHRLCEEQNPNIGCVQNSACVW